MKTTSLFSDQPSTFQQAKATMQGESQSERTQAKSQFHPPQPYAPQAPPAPQNGNDIDEARKHLCQAANLYNLCVKCVNNMIADELPEVARTSEQFQAAVGTLFIEASRAGFVSKMPTAPVRKANHDSANA